MSDEDIVITAWRFFDFVSGGAGGGSSGGEGGLDPNPTPGLSLTSNVKTSGRQRHKRQTVRSISFRGT